MNDAFAVTLAGFCVSNRGFGEGASPCLSGRWGNEGGMMVLLWDCIGVKQLNA